MIDKQAAAFELGMVQRFKAAGLDEQRTTVALGIAARLDDHPSLDNIHQAAVKAAAAKRSTKMASEKTAEQVQKETDAFEFGMGLTLKKAGVSDPQSVQQFMQIAATIAANEQTAGK